MIACYPHSNPRNRWMIISDQFRAVAVGPSSVDALVALAADHESLPPSHGHQVHPFRFLSSSWLGEVCELAEVVNFYVVLAAQISQHLARAGGSARCVCCWP